jgi:methyl-accepting chemotaxis protein
MAANQVDGLAKNVDLIAAVKEGKQDKIGEAISRFELEQRCDYFIILDAGGKVIYHSSSPEQIGESQKDWHNVNMALTTKKSYASFETSPTIRLSARVSTPIFDENRNLIGLASGGYRIDTAAWVDAVQQRYNVECTTFVGDERVATTVRKQDGSGNRAVGTKLNNPPIYDAV